VFEVPFDAGTKVGKMESYDLFGDGSVQILNAPGHAVGHICALVRTTEDSYLLLGGDTCHFVGKLDCYITIKR
jgi:glyoxylase-like metal-dependent hydrolase (beta-lactamase superfamily II)